MNVTCLWAERVAMLLDNEDAGVRAHVADCPSCSALVAELEEDRSLLREMPVPPLNVRVPGRRPMMPVWPWAAALAASIALAIWLWPRPAAPVPPVAARYTPPAAVMPASRPPVPAMQSRRPPSVRRTPRLSLAAALEAALPPPVHPPVRAAGEVIIAMQTEDPNVLIVLLGESND